MPAVVKSAAAGLDSASLISDGKWCLYCCCTGFGCDMNKVGAPYFGKESTNLCIHSTCTTTDLSAYDGFCGCVQVNGTSTQQMQLLPLGGAPTCICCNIPIAPGGTVVWDSSAAKVVDLPKVFADSWWYIYMVCCGYGYSGLQAGDRPMYASLQKCLCIRSSMVLEENQWPGAGKGGQGCKEGICKDGDDVCMSSLSKNLCCFSQGQIPPAASSPFCVICNKPLGGLTSDKC